MNQNPLEPQNVPNEDKSLLSPINSVPEEGFSSDTKEQSSSIESSPSVLSPLNNELDKKSPESSITSYSANDVQKVRKKVKLKLIIPIILVILLIGLVYGYFGYYMSPNTIWNNSLGNASIGYNKLVNYFNAGSRQHYSGVNISGTFNLQSGTNHYNGVVNIQSEGQTSLATINLDLGLGKVELNERSLPATGSPDPNVYLQINGINQFNNYFSAYAPLLDNLNGQWVEIDHNIIADAVSQSTKNQTSNLLPTWSNIGSFLLTTDLINKKYLFSTNKSDAVLIIKKNYGAQNINGIYAEHYLVGFNKINARFYLSALCNAYMNSSLGNYLKQNTNSSSTNNSSICNTFADRANSLNNADTFQLWDDVNSRIPYMIRFTSNNNPLENYIDVGLDQNASNNYPFFIEAIGKTGNTTIHLLSNITLDTSNRSIVAGIKVADGSTIFNGSFSFLPSNKTISTQAPTASVPLTTELNNLNLGALASTLPVGKGN
jgi:hypothetical protein